MTTDGPNSDWPEPVITFLKDHLPQAMDGSGWEDHSSSAYQMGCLALVALGQAVESDRGATALTNPSLPNTLPRWDDICVTVLWLASHWGKLNFRLPDGSVPRSEHNTGTFTIQRIGAPPPPPPNIFAGKGIRPARATPEVLYVLEGLGLVGETGLWADQAETVLWRYHPRNWGDEVTSDLRYLSAIEQAVETLPGDIREPISRLTTVSDGDVDEWMETQETAESTARAKYGPKGVFSIPITIERAKSSIVSKRRNDLDWLFFRRWRLPDGWLSEQQAARAIEIFHDPLAIQTRRAVLAKLCPDKPEFSE
ncbi:hypothetical protein [Hwanghaeella sp.]|uniref:hypothetical protein n=1 Tax=Hwanghaeella sp. TaxID=2605943 RepID=UPI003CCBFAAB